jgi:hypothetical protein
VDIHLLRNTGSYTGDKSRAAASLPWAPSRSRVQTRNTHILISKTAGRPALS